ncbi:hypothetical protein Taro_020918 [Colocasia esculenta]|uniref:Histidine kinase/HSP90-like ATPase domain-containing protein n=1 Tax=Colocasia esculenta TaxID=4460 RepID=A0A843V3S8_COLES|nr:hypothetical protein [Colocasia esculenta]
MLGASRRTASALVRGGSARYRCLAPPLAAAPAIFPDSVAEGDAKEIYLPCRWFSVLSVPSKGGHQRTLDLSRRRRFSLSIRHQSSSAAADPTDAGERFEYQAEVSRLMDLIVHSLYSNKEVFLRELISNASDALDKLRFLSVTEPELLKEAVDLDIRIQTDKDNGIITITDTGIGMTRQELIDCLGTIAQSGTAKFLKAVKVVLRVDSTLPAQDSKEAGSDNNLMGQFGVGFYSAFLVSDRVVVSTKSPKSDKQYVWEGEADAGSYMIREETDPSKLIPRGTQIALHLKHDDKGFAHPERIQNLVKNYSQFVSFPIYTWQEKGYTKEVEVDEDPSEPKKESDEDTKTELRNPKDVTTEEYNEFYKNTFKEYLDPLASSHFTTEPSRPEVALQMRKDSVPGVQAAVFHLRQYAHLVEDLIGGLGVADLGALDSHQGTVVEAAHEDVAVATGAEEFVAGEVIAFLISWPVKFLAERPLVLLALRMSWRSLAMRSKAAGCGAAA